MHRKSAFEHEVALGGKGLRVFLKHGIQLRTSTCPVDLVLQLVLASREVITLAPLHENRRSLHCRVPEGPDGRHTTASFAGVAPGK